jgi:hypothetical protein
VRKLKQCSRCKKWKKKSEFSKHKRECGGLDYWCKLCKNACQAIYVEKNRKQINKKRRNYNKTHKVKIKNQRKKYKQSTPWAYVFYGIKQRCNNQKNSRYKYYGGRGIKCLLSKEEVKSLWYRDKAWLLKRPSIDRKDNDGDYTYNNCQFIEQSLNFSKRNSQIASKIVLQFDLQGNFIREWKSVRRASIEMQISESTISKCARGQLKTSYGFIWKYK